MGLSIIVMLFSGRNSAFLQAVSSDTPWPALLGLGFCSQFWGSLLVQELWVGAWDQRAWTDTPWHDKGLVAWPDEGHWGTWQKLMPPDFPSLHCEGIKLRGSFVCGLSSDAQAQVVIFVVVPRLNYFKVWDVCNTAVGNLGLRQWGNLVSVSEGASVPQLVTRVLQVWQPQGSWMLGQGSVLSTGTLGLAIVCLSAWSVCLHGGGQQWE